MPAETDHNSGDELALLVDFLKDAGGQAFAGETEPSMDSLREIHQQVARFHLSYKFAADAMLTRLNTLREEFELTHDYSLFENVSSRQKSVESLLQKVSRIDCPPTISDIRDRIRDIAGIRVICVSTSDAYWIGDMLISAPDVEIVEIKDYISDPKSNGYRSLHLVVRVPAYLSDRVEMTYVEVQVRTVAMDLWASVEHKVYYKSHKSVPDELLAELRDAAGVAAQLDHTMSRLQTEIGSVEDIAPSVTDGIG